ncbi:LysM peptidoglycan-binding domain-containing protein [Fervidibacillus halotolerans]|uniref:LysM peptidoglycan-binding domain-containing protein n=1 Tax=Fervidibacillus halotolerans TaxID=2980027 RepID=A0A9E8RXV4_9BACI|nr:LysM peptidoglycan-binding domain-containing protein [Fervidibacillus halotolerans]WAA11594.1 LysM peptidoglycan-binding domain-containing protein [Fervidibacillus halotolerans]
MTNTNRPMTLKFSLEETVWFRKGDEIQELINLSLEPNVTIQELNHFITIQGSLDLHGEYKSAEPSDEQDETLSFTGQKFANVLETRDEGICEFSYHFPVDITIPKTRVKNIDEIDLLIDMFDYRIVENNCLQVSTDLLVTGVYNEIPTNDLEETNVRDTDEEWTSDFMENEQYYNRPETEPSLSPLEDLEEEPFDISVEATKREKSEDVSEPHEQIPIQIFPHSTDEIEELTLDSIEHAQEKKVEKKERKIEHQSLANETKENLVTEKAMESNDILDTNKGELEDKGYASKERADVPKEDKDPVYSDGIQEKGEKKENLELVGSSRGDMISQRDLEQFWHEDTVQGKDLEKQMAFRSTASNDSRTSEERTGMVDEMNDSKLEEPMGQDKEHRDDREDKNIHYQSQENTNGEEKPISLTEYFARKEEPKSTRMTVYIVQEDDQLSDIAEKYDIQISQLLRMNRLDTQHEVYEGQVLFIPQNEKVVHSDD